jgi:hypothetical protein
MNEAIQMKTERIAVEPPYRRKQAARIDLKADVDDVFALMCPVREYEWEPGWTTTSIFSNSGLVEQDCIFTTPPGASSGSKAATWITPLHDPENRRLTMYKFVPDETVTRLDIHVEKTGTGSMATVSYEITALSPSGKPYVDRHTDAAYGDMMASWKTAIEAHAGV